MKFKLFIEVIVFLTLVFTFKQAKSEEVTNKSFQYYDSITYQQYLAGDWNNLIFNGKQALATGYDYKYLRLRMGFAYYFKNNFRTAADHFLKALHFDSYDTIAALYFNLSCQAAGRSGELYHTKGSPKPYRTLDFVYADAGTMLVGDVSDSATLSDSNVYYKELIQPVSRTYASFGLSLRPLSNLSVFLGYSQINLTDKKSFGYLSQDAVQTSVTDTTYGKVYNYSFPVVKNYAEKEFRNQQKSFYLSLNYYPVPGLKITPAFHILHINAQRVFAVQTQTALSDTAWYNKYDTSWHTFDYTAYDYEITTSDTSYYDHVISLSVSKEMGRFCAEINGTSSRIMDKKINQLGASLSWYPFGNTNLYAHSSFTYQIENDIATTTQNGSSTTKTIFEQMVGGKLYKQGWIEGYITFGEIKNFTDKYAYLVYNQVYPIKSRIGITFYPYIGRHLELMLMYRYEKMGLYLTTTSADTQSLVTNPDCNTSIVSSGVKWKF